MATPARSLGTSVLGPLSPLAPLSPTSPHSPAVASPPPAGYVPHPAHSPLRVAPRVLDPYEPQPEFNLPWLGRILLFIIDIPLVPLRIIFILVLLIILWLLCSILTIGASHAKQAGDRGFGPIRTALIRFVVKLIATPFCWCFGLVVSHHTHAGAKAKEGVILSNHIGYVEILALVAAYAPSVVAKAEVASYPLIGPIARALQCVFVNRKDPADRERVRLLLMDRANPQSDRKFPPLLLFPEGTTSNGHTLLKLQKGIFLSGAPLQPVVVRTHFCYFNSGWVRGGMGGHILSLLTRLYHSVSLSEMELYAPSQYEKDDAILYADNVAQSMANELWQQVSTKTMFDNPELVETIKRRQHLREMKEAREGNTVITVLTPSATAGGGGGAQQDAHMTSPSAQDVRIAINAAANDPPLTTAAQQEVQARYTPRMQTAKVGIAPASPSDTHTQQQPHQQSAAAANAGGQTSAPNTARRHRWGSGSQPPLPGTAVESEQQQPERPHSGGRSHRSYNTRPATIDV